MRFSSIDNRSGTFLPNNYWYGHELCFFIHDIMGHMLAAGERAGIFCKKFQLNVHEAEALNNAENVFQWLDSHRTPEERTDVLVTTVFPAVLSDMLHCIYEALECSRKAKLTITYMLLRKPIQESLYVLEKIIVDRGDFAKRLTDSPVKLWSQGVGGCDAHKSNIGNVLALVDSDGRFNSDYLAQLRYDKSANDGFDGISNKAIHLFTSHKSIVTEPMNINFIFSNWSSKESQWAFIYSRLPYILAYMYRVVESVCAGITPTYPTYLEELERRMAAHVLLWSDTLNETYASEPLLVFVAKNREWLSDHCQSNGYRSPGFRDLVRMRETGAFPGETYWSVRHRMRHFQEAAEISGSASPTWRTRLWRTFGFGTLIER